MHDLGKIKTDIHQKYQKITILQNNHCLFVILNIPHYLNSQSEPTSGIAVFTARNERRRGIPYCLVLFCHVVLKHFAIGLPMGFGFNDSEAVE